MKQLNRKNFIPLCLLLVGMLAAVVLLGPRIVLEQENRHISVVMSYPDAQQLAAASGVSTERCLERLASGGLSAVVLPEEGGTFDAAAAETVHHAGLGLILSPAADMTLPAYLAAREDLGSV